MPVLKGRVLKKTGTQYLFHTGRRWAWLPKAEVVFREPKREPESPGERVVIFISAWLDKRLKEKGEWQKRASRKGAKAQGEARVEI